MITFINMCIRQISYEYTYIYICKEIRSRSHFHIQQVKIEDHKSLTKQYILQNNNEKTRYRFKMQSYTVCKKQYALSTKVIINYNFVLSRDISKCANYTYVIVCNRWRPPHAIIHFEKKFIIFFCVS